MTSILIAVVLGAAALAAAWLINRRKRRTGPAAGPHIPDRVDRADFARPDASVLVVAFTSSTCTSCAAMLAAVRSAEGAAVAVDEAEATARADVHRRYAIDAVPIAIVVDAGGVVRASFAGSVTPDDLRTAIAQVATR